MTSVLREKASHFVAVQ